MQALLLAACQGKGYKICGDHLAPQGELQQTQAFLLAAQGRLHEKHLAQQG